MTNNSTKSRKQYGRKFETLGLSVDEVGRVLNIIGTPRHEPASVRRFRLLLLLLLTDETAGRGSLLASAQEEIFASSFAAAAYLQSIDFPKDKKVPLAIRNNARNMREV